MITTTQATQYLDSMLGVGAPAWLVDAAVTDVATTEPAMIAAGYSAATMVRVQSMAVALIVAAGNPRRVSNQGAASGASRGFKYNDRDLTALRRSLAALDTAGTVSALIGPDPAGAAFLMVV